MRTTRVQRTAMATHPTTVNIEETSMKKSLLVSLITTLLCSALPAWAQQAAQDFPDGLGKQTVLSVCGGCHEVNRVRAGYTPEGWQTVIRMHQNVAAPVPQDQWGNVAEYLTKNFPEKPRPIMANGTILSAQKHSPWSDSSRTGP
jgi:hypothetical protein